MTPEEVSVLPVGAVIRVEGIFYLVYERRVAPKTGRPFPLVMVIDWVEAFSTRPTDVGQDFPDFPDYTKTPTPKTPIRAFWSKF